jgi:heme A synthase
LFVVIGLHIADIAITESATWYIAIIIGVSLLVFITIIVYFRRDTGRRYLWIFVLLIHIVALLSVGLTKSLLDNPLWPYLILFFNFLVFLVLIVTSLYWLPATESKLTQVSDTSYSVTEKQEDIQDSIQSHWNIRKIIE